MRVEASVPQSANRKALREMVTRLQKETFDRIKELRRDQEQESETEPGDEMDVARATEDVETHASLIARAEEKLRYLDEALTRLEQGKYGNCLGCHGPIPLERLKALPFAAYCVDCQEKRNRARRDWSEGTMIQPYDHQWTVPEEMEEPIEREYRSTAPKEELALRSRAPVKTEAAASKKKRATSAKTRVVRRKK